MIFKNLLNKDLKIFNNFFNIVKKYENYYESIINKLKI